MAFHEVRLPARLMFGSTGGVERRTEVVTLGSGHERRSTPWQSGRRRYLIGANLRSLDDMAEMTAFFEARWGRLYGFRFRDFADFKSCAPTATVGPVDQQIGVGDGTTAVFALRKRYGEGDAPFVREISKPVDGTVRVAVDGAETSAFTVDLTTGLLTLTSVPASGAIVSAGFEFDTPVRFDTDRIEITLETFDAGRMAAAPLIEIRI